MKTQTETLSGAEVGMAVAGGLASAALGILTAIWMQSAIASQSSIFWFISRSAGIVAYLLLWLSIAWGVTISSKGIGGRVSGPLAYALHNVTSWLALGFSAVHAIALLGDYAVPFTALGIIIPFMSGYQPVLTGLGTLSFYLGVIVTSAFYLKKRLGYRAWRTIHGLSYVMFMAVTAHSILLGTDTSTTVMKAIYVVAGGSALLLTLFRVALARNSRKAPAGRTPAATRELSI
jgi:predicted ferric reductase